MTAPTGTPDPTPTQPQETRSWFASRRERRLWVWTLAVVVAIYSTLGLARKLADTLSEAAQLILFVLGMLLVAVTILTQGLQVRPRGREVAVALGLTTVCLMVFVRMTIPAERSHVIEYGVLAVFIYEALKERAAHGRRVPAPGPLAVLMTSLIGVLDESLQAVLPSRVFDPRDMLFNVLAALMAVIVSAILTWAREWKR